MVRVLTSTRSKRCLFSCARYMSASAPTYQGFSNRLVVADGVPDVGVHCCELSQTLGLAFVVIALAFLVARGI